MTCQKPDHNSPELICGYPLPCPWHSVIIDLKPDPAMITIPATAAKSINMDRLDKLKRIARILKGE